MLFAQVGDPFAPGRNRVRRDTLWHQDDAVPGQTEPLYDSAVVSILGDRHAYELELAATIHFVHKLRDAPSRTELIQDVTNLKPRFESSQVDELYRELLEQGLLVSSSGS